MPDINNKEEILEKYKNENTVLYPVVEGGAVIAQEIDDKNRLLYIIRKNDELSVEFASNITVEKIIQSDPPHVVTITTQR